MDSIVVGGDGQIDQKGNEIPKKLSLEENGDPIHGSR